MHGLPLEARIGLAKGHLPRSRILALLGLLGRLGDELAQLLGLVGEAFHLVLGEFRVNLNVFVHIPRPGQVQRIGEARVEVGLGDLEMSANDQTLWTVNLFTRELLEIPIGVLGTAPAAAQISRYSLAQANLPGLSQLWVKI